MAPEMHTVAPAPGKGRHSADSNQALDVSSLPTYAFSHRSLMWWGTFGMMLIEGTVFGLMVFSYFYLASHADVWPMSRYAPDLAWGTLNTAVMIASAFPNHWAKRAAEAQDLRKVRGWLLACMMFSFLFLAIRVLEFRHLNVAWDSNAYGSAVWLLLGLHTVHLITDTVDSLVLTVLMFYEPVGGKSYVDVSENGLYWYFVVFTWLPIYAVIYLVPRWIAS
ncbi:cytochrome c oxidase subunit 3 [Methylobacillus flagellatus]|uniref:cytochrome c oxidase subunit 3 n=1 Tax=Methylobacillus flagellatus TaxID=405 RepID=UPI0028691B71|nr:cytochrome c oxidase subunit 3 [Methylobacillus flagellatus]